MGWAGWISGYSSIIPRPISPLTIPLRGEGGKGGYWVDLQTEIAWLWISKNDNKATSSGRWFAIKTTRISTFLVLSGPFWSSLVTRFRRRGISCKILRHSSRHFLSGCFKYFQKWLLPLLIIWKWNMRDPDWSESDGTTTGIKWKLVNAARVDVCIPNRNQFPPPPSYYYFFLSVACEPDLKSLHKWLIIRGSELALVACPDPQLMSKCDIHFRLLSPIVLFIYLTPFLRLCVCVSVC